MAFMQMVQNNMIRWKNSQTHNQEARSDPSTVWMSLLDISILDFSILDISIMDISIMGISDSQGIHGPQREAGPAGAQGATWNGTIRDFGSTLFKH